MTLGLTIGIAAAFLWSIVNIIDKYLVERFCRDTGIGALIILSSLVPGVVIPVGFLLSDGTVLIQKSGILILLISGALTTLWIGLYLHALLEEDVSVVTALFQLTPVFALLLGIVFLGEMLTLTQLAAGCIVVLGSIAISLEPSSKKIKWKPLLYISGASMTVAFMNVLFKFVAADIQFWTAIFWQAIGTFATGILVYLFYNKFRASLLRFLKKNAGLGISLNLFNESITVIGDVLFAFAILLAPLAIIQTTESFQPIFVFFMVLLLAATFPKLAHEDFSRSAIIQKILGIFLVVSGTIVLYL